MSELQDCRGPVGAGEKAPAAPDQFGPFGTSRNIIALLAPQRGSGSPSTGDPNGGEGRKQAFLDLLMPHYPKALAYSQTITGSLMDGEDLVSDAVLLAYSRFDQLKDPGKFKSWFFAILLNRFKNLRRRNLLRTLTLVAEPSGHPYYLEATARTSGDPAELGYQLTLVKELLNRLRPDERDVIMLLGPAEFSVDEAARTLKLSPRAVIQRAYRARKKLAKLAPKDAFPFLMPAEAKVRNDRI